MGGIICAPLGKCTFMLVHVFEYYSKTTEYLVSACVCVCVSASVCVQRSDTLVLRVLLLHTAGCTYSSASGDKHYRSS